MRYFKRSRLQNEAPCSDRAYLQASSKASRSYPMTLSDKLQLVTLVMIALGMLWMCIHASVNASKWN